MIYLDKKIYSILSLKRKKQFILLQVLVILSGITELIFVGSIAPFMAIVTDPSIINSNFYLNEIYEFLGSSNSNDFIISFGIILLSVLLVLAVFSAFVTYVLGMFGARVGIEIGDRLYQNYMNKDWKFHMNANSSNLVNKISIEANRVTDYVVHPLLTINSRAVILLFLIVAILITNPIAAIITATSFFVIFLSLFLIVRKRLDFNGKIISSAFEKRFKLMSEGFGGIREMILYQRINRYISDFLIEGKQIAISKGENNGLSQVPRYAIEFSAFASVVLLIIFLVKNYNGDLTIVLSTVAVFALAGFKLLPAAQQIYASLAFIKGHEAALDNIFDDLYVTYDQNEISNEHINFEKEIALENISFGYPNKKGVNIFDGLNLNIKKNSTIGFTGPSGSGKSTIISIICGLLNPLNGKLLIDRQAINKNNISGWQNKIGYVQQDIFTIDASIAENIAFGIPKNEINFERVIEVCKLARVDEFLKDLASGIDTNIGERGASLSGGQVQRIAIARALYNDPELIIFDEATSSLDNLSEKQIMSSLNNFSKNKTILIVAHRLDTLKKCDLILYFEDGNIVESGSYEQLINSSSNFKKMAESIES